MGIIIRILFLLAIPEAENRYVFGEYIGHYDLVVLIVSMFLLMTVADRYLGARYPLVSRILAPLAMIPFHLAYYRDYTGTTEIVLWILAILLPFIVFQIHRAEIAREQSERDTKAKKTLKQVKATKRSKSDFVLYLRGFAWENNLTTQNMDLTSSGFDAPTHIDFETIIERSLRPLDMVAVGDPSDVYGAGKVQTKNADWKKVVSDLAAAAKLIIYVPSATVGAIWEAEELVISKYLDKSVFLMPMSPTESSSYHNEWNSARTIMGTFGLELPMYQAGGMLFRYYKNKKLASCKSLKSAIVSTFKVRRTFKKVVPWL